MDNNSMAIVIFCSHLCVGEDVRPLEPKEWSEMVKFLLSKKMQPNELLDFSQNDFKNTLNADNEQATRLFRLSQRSASLAFELDRLSNMGIDIVTRADIQYPKQLKKILGNGCPPLFYYAGDLNLLNHKLIGFVGSRTVGDEDIKFVKSTVVKVIANGYGVVSGGAKGVDEISTKTAIEKGGIAVEFLSDSLFKNLKNTDVINAIRNKQLLLISVTKPDAGFNAGFAMSRNKFIYVSSQGTVVVKSDYNKGGTWSGATECIKKDYSPVFCWNKNSYVGNNELIKRGALPIDENWDADISKVAKKQTAEQLTLFD